MSLLLELKNNFIYSVTLKTTKDGIAPQSPSSLKYLWDFISDDWQKTQAKSISQERTQQETKGKPQYLRRLPLNFEIPEAPPNLKTDLALDVSIEEDEKRVYDWAGIEARCLGNVLHRYFESIVKQGLNTWNESRLSQQIPSLKAALLAEGIFPAQSG